MNIKTKIMKIICNKKHHSCSLPLRGVLIGGMSLFCSHVLRHFPAVIPVQIDGSAETAVAQSSYMSVVPYSGNQTRMLYSM